MSGHWSRILVVLSVIAPLFFSVCLSLRPDRRPRRTSISAGPATPSPSDPQQPRRRRTDEDEQLEAIMFRMFEDHLLANLDFEVLPRPPVNTTLPPVPDYMFRLYQHLRTDTGQQQEQQQRRSHAPSTTYSEDTNDILQETIRGYHVMSENWQRPGLRYLVFNTTSQPLKENITHVELVLYMCQSSAPEEPSENNENSEKSEETPASPSTQQHVNVTVTMQTKRWRQHNRIQIRLPVDRNRSSLSINITKMVQRSFARRQTIMNLSIETPSITHPSVPQPCQSNTSEEEKKRPLLVIYENILPFSEKNREDNDTSRQKRRVAETTTTTEQNVTADQEEESSANASSTFLSIQMRTENNGTDLDGNSTDSDLDLDSGSVLSPANDTNSTSGPVTYPVHCHLRRWYVSFQEMLWHHVILYPPGYNANYCWGVCPDNLDDTNSTNHAFIRSKFMLLQRLDPDIPKPFCSPIRMTPLTLLYRNKYDVIIAKRFIDMVVAGCSCQ